MIKKALILLLLLSAGVLLKAKPANPIVFNVKVYGAAGNGQTLDTKAINAAIAAAAKAGGGQVYFPAGNYLSGSVHLQSNVALYLEQGATLIATAGENNGEYDSEETAVNTKYQDSGHSHFHNSLIWGENLHDVSLLGPGRIWGKGLLKDYKKGTKLGNKAIALYKCRNVIIQDISILHGGWFAILATGVDNLSIKNVKLDTNRDGMDIDCCQNVRIADCFVNSPFDDGICLKSTYALGYARSTKNVTITGCQVSGYDEGTLLDGTFKRSTDLEYKDHPTGRIKLGTESNGGFQNVAIANCVFDYCRGLALETVDGALLEDVTVSNITMRDVVNDPIFLRLGARMRGPEGTPIGQLQRVIISNINVYNADPYFTCTLSGLPGHEIQDVQFNNIQIFYKGGVNNGQPNRDVPEQADKYPEPGMFGQAPAYGFFIRHAKNIRLNNVQLHVMNPDNRPPLRADDVKGLYLFQVSGQQNTDGKYTIFNNVNDVHAFKSLGLPQD